MNKKWKAKATKGNTPVTLYTLTTDEQISQDLASGSKSHIQFARRTSYRGGTTNETDHRDFAEAILSGFNEGDTYSNRSPLEPADTIPEGLERHNIWGINGAVAATVFVATKG